MCVEVWQKVVGSAVCCHLPSTPWTPSLRWAPPQAGLMPAQVIPVPGPWHTQPVLTVGCRAIPHSELRSVPSARPVLSRKGTSSPVSGHVYPPQSLRVNQMSCPAVLLRRPFNAVYPPQSIHVYPRLSSHPAHLRSASKLSGNESRQFFCRSQDSNQRPAISPL